MVKIFLKYKQLLTFLFNQRSKYRLIQTTFLNPVRGYHFLL